MVRRPRLLRRGGSGATGPTDRSGASRPEGTTSAPARTPRTPGDDAPAGGTEGRPEHESVAPEHGSPDTEPGPLPSWVRPRLTSPQ
ncbi:hypothetical protein PU560_01385, partial [Georgenia sp. 10Sc9-8]|nr:hypothetical protein [Georgenia halotolerans]